MSSSSDDENKNSRLLRVRIRRLPAVAGGVPDSIVAYVGAVQRVLRSPTTATVVLEKHIAAMNQVLPAACRPSFSFFCICVVSGLLEGRKTKIPEWSFCSSEIGILHSKLLFLSLLGMILL